VRKNGFVTFYIVLLGIITLVLVEAVSMLAVQYLILARQYKETLVMSYVSESALLVTWDEFTRQSRLELPQRKRWIFQDELGFMDKEQRVEINCTTLADAASSQGALRAIAYHEKTGIQRSCGINFKVQDAEDGVESQYSIRKIMY
jgi:hypothetical protein